MHKKIFLGIAGIVLALMVFQNSLARFTWENFQYPVAALRLNRGDVKLAYEIGNYYFGAGAYDLNIAEVAYKKALSIDPRFALANYQLARIYFVKGQTELALSAINRELESHPENRRSLYIRGLIYGFSGKLPEAEDDFRKFTEWSPSEWAGYNDLSWIFAKSGKFEESVENIENAFKNVPRGSDNVWLQNSLGVAYLNLKKYKEAEAAFLKAKELAAVLTIVEWRAAYPGNSGGDAEKGFSTFRAAIEANLTKTRYLDNSS